jgi:uncharacterized membrane protein YhaH (DUF805 family)
MKTWYPYLNKNSKREFWWMTLIHVFLFIGGVVMMCFNMPTGSYGLILIITYIPYYFGIHDLGEARKRTHDMGLPPIDNYRTMK